MVKLHTVVFIKFNQLKVSLAHGSTGFAALIAVMRIMPVQGVALESAGLFEQRHQAYAVGDLLTTGVDTRDLEQGRIKIHAAYRRMADAARSHDAGPFHNPRDANATFIQVTLP